MIEHMTHSLILSMHQPAPGYVVLRRASDRYPNLRLAEIQAFQLIIGRLVAWCSEVHSGLVTTGAVATLCCGTGAKHLRLRANLDALSIKNATGRDWASVQDGHLEGASMCSPLRAYTRKRNASALHGDSSPETRYLNFTPDTTLPAAIRPYTIHPGKELLP